MTLRQLAALVDEGVTSAYLSRVETGTRYPSLELLIDLSRPLNVTALYLLTGEDGLCPCCGRGRNGEGRRAAGALPWSGDQQKKE